MKKTIEAILTLTPTEDQRKVQQAIDLALERHAGQMRLNSEPHAAHVLRVGLAVGEWATTQMPKALTTLILIGILHDTLEDTPTTDKELATFFGTEVARNVRALSHIEEEEPDEVYLSRVAAGGKLAVVVKRYDKLDNLGSLANAPAEFRQTKLSETRAALPIWQRIDPAAVPLFEAAMAKLSA